MKSYFLLSRPLNFSGVIVILLILFLTKGSIIQGKDGIGDSHPIPTRTYRPDYPDNLRSQGIVGNALIKFTINKQGSVVDSEVISATHESFGIASIDALRQWQFIPARKNGEIISKQVQQRFKFTLSVEELAEIKVGREVFIKVKGRIIKADELDTSPVPINTVIPIYPEELIDSGIEGEAQVKFIIDKDGYVINPQIMSTDHEKFTLNALIASLKMKFEPVKLKGRFWNVEMEKSFSFSENTEDK